MALGRRRIVEVDAHQVAVDAHVPLAPVALDAFGEPDAAHGRSRSGLLADVHDLVLTVSRIPRESTEPSRRWLPHSTPLSALLSFVAVAVGLDPHLSCSVVSWAVTTYLGMVSPSLVRTRHRSTERPMHPTRGLFCPQIRVRERVTRFVTHAADPPTRVEAPRRGRSIFRSGLAAGWPGRAGEGGPTAEAWRGPPQFPAHRVSRGRALARKVPVCSEIEERELEAGGS